MDTSKEYFSRQEPALQQSYLGAPSTAPDEAEEKDLVDYVKAFVRHKFNDQLVYCNETFYSYREGYWPALDPRTDVRKEIALYLGKRAKPQLIASYVSLLQDLYAEKALEEPGALICLGNGTLNPEMGELIRHSPTPKLRTKLDIEWDERAQCPRFLKFLDEVFEPDSDKAEKIACLQQFFGYCLVADASMHKFLWVVGSGGNGKSQLLEVLTNIVGPENLSHAHIDRFEDAAVRAELEGKLVNVSFELTSDATIQGGNFKAIVSGDRIEARRLYQRSFSFKPYVRLVCATNDLPRLSDLTGGFSRRAIIIRFNRIFAEAEQDKNLIDKLLAERSGILAWAVRGLQAKAIHDSGVVFC
jgi:putative DNA primase/helicase